LELQAALQAEAQAKLAREKAIEELAKNAKKLESTIRTALAS
jgi:hypothetical protein